MIITEDGKMIRTKVSGIPVYGRSTQGVKILETDGESRVISLAVLEEDKD